VSNREQAQAVYRRWVDTEKAMEVPLLLGSVVPQGREVAV
jgi:hypothetical protein